MDYEYEATIILQSESNSNSIELIILNQLLNTLEIEISETEFYPITPPQHEQRGTHYAYLSLG